MRRPDLLSRIRHGMLLAALLCILLARVAVPAGWMPMVGADGGIVLAPCSGMGAMRMAHDDVPKAAAMPGMKMGGMDMSAHHAAPDDTEKRHPDPAGDHPCSGAGVTVALEAPPTILPLALRLPPTSVLPARLIPGIGRGLAAPPPPSTGPPILV